MVELKSVIDMGEAHLSQAINYLEAYNMEIGLLINFGSRSLQFKRVHNNKLLGLKPPIVNQGHPSVINHAHP